MHILTFYSLSIEVPYLQHFGFESQHLMAMCLNITSQPIIQNRNLFCIIKSLLNCFQQLLPPFKNQALTLNSFQQVVCLKPALTKISHLIAFLPNQNTCYNSNISCLCFVYGNKIRACMYQKSTTTELYPLTLFIPSGIPLYYI